MVCHIKVVGGPTTRSCLRTSAGVPKSLSNRPPTQVDTGSLMSSGLLRRYYESVVGTPRERTWSEIIDQTAVSAGLTLQLAGFPGRHRHNEL